MIKSGKECSNNHTEKNNNYFGTVILIIFSLKQAVVIVDNKNKIVLLGMSDSQSGGHKVSISRLLFKKDSWIFGEDSLWGAAIFTTSKSTVTVILAIWF